MSAIAPTLYDQILSDLHRKRDLIDKAITGMVAIGEVFGGITVAEVAPTALLPQTTAAPAAKRPKPQIVPRGRKAKVAATNGRPKIDTAPTCLKHPDNTDFDKHRHCRVCGREYAKAHYAKTHPKKGAAAHSKRASLPDPKPEPHVPDIDDLDDVEIEEPDPEHLEDDEDPAPELPGMAAREASGIPERHLTHEFVYSKPTRCPKCGMEGTRLRRMKYADLAKDCWIHPGSNCTIKISHYQIKDDLKYQPEAA